MRIPTILAAACLMLVGCSKEGCTDPEAANYNRRAVEDDGSCEYPPEIDGYTYDVVTIDQQVWFAENLRTTVYANGDVIPAGFTDDYWTSTTSGATAVYGEGNSDCYSGSPDFDACDEAQSLQEYGRLYNWYAVDDARGLCPSGWHVPTDEEWRVLEAHMTSQGFDGTEGTALSSTFGWNDGDNGTDDFGFSALPGGFRRDDYGIFDGAGYYGYWWSPWPDGGGSGARSLYRGNSTITRSYYDPRYGFSVRCMRNAE